MSPEERQLLAGMFERIKANSAAPRDQEAEAFITDQIKGQPSAPYLLAQTVIVQDFALQAANQKLQQLEARVHELESAPKPSTSFLGGLLGGGAPPAPPPRPAPPPPAYGQPQGGPWGAAPPPPPGYAPREGGYAQPGFAPQGAPGFAPPASGGFLKGALGAAAGVAGGVLLADGIRSLFHGGGGIGSGLGIDSGFQHTGLGQGDETIVNNYYGDASGAGTQDAGYDAADDDGAQDADYEPDDGYDSGGDGGFDA